MRATPIYNWLSMWASGKEIKRVDGDVEIRQDRSGGSYFICPYCGERTYFFRKVKSKGIFGTDYLCKGCNFFGVRVW